MELRDIEYFYLVAQQRHLGRASEALGLTQPALSKSLRRLESALGAKLVRRTHAGVELTAEGTALAARVQGLRLSLEDVAREVRDVSNGRLGTLRAGAAPGVPEQLVSSPCAALLREAPQVRVLVTVGHNNVLLPALRSGDLDLVVSGVPERPYEHLVQERICDDTFAVYCATAHPLAGRRRLRPTDLVDYRWASAATDVLAWQWLTRTFANHKLPTPLSAFEAASYPLRARVTAMSDLLCFNSRSGFVEDAHGQRLVELAVEDLAFTRKIGVSYRKGAYLSPTVQRFVKLLKLLAAQIAGT